MKRLFSESTIIVAIALLTMVLNIVPFLYRLVTTPPDRTFVGTQFYTPDYNIYLGHFKEGQKGIWLVHDKHTGEPQKGFLLRREYIVWGFLTGYILHLPIVYVYHSARIAGGFITLLLFYFLLKEVFPDNNKNKENLPAKYKRIAGFILGTLVAGFGKTVIDPVTGKISTDLFLFWFTEIDAAARYAPLFHYQIGYIILLSVLIVFIKYLKNKISLLKSLLICIPLGLFAPISHPATFVTIYLIFAIFLFIRIFINLLSFHPNKDNSINSSLIVSLIPKETLWIMIFIISTIPIVPFLISEVNTFPWNEIAKWDLAARTPVDFNEYVLALGPTFFLGTAGVIILIIKNLIFKNSLKISNLKFQINLLIVCFPLATFLLVFFIWPYLLNINRIRFMQVPIFIPLAIFSTIFLIKLSEMIGSLSKYFFLSKYKFQIQLCTLIFTLCTLIAITFPSFKWGILREVGMFPIGDYLVHPPTKWVIALEWMDKNTKPSEVVLASYHAGGLLPGISGNTSYFGHPWSTVKYGEKEQLATKFFQSLMTEKEAKDFLKKGYINYVFYGYQEKSYGGDISKYQNLLSKIYETPSVTVYRVKN